MKFIFFKKYVFDILISFFIEVLLSNETETGNSLRMWIFGDPPTCKHVYDMNDPPPSPPIYKD